MNKETMTQDALLSSTPNRMTRRQMLRTSAQTGLVLGSASFIGGALLTACGDSGAGAQVTLTLADWPVKASVLTSKKPLTDPDDISEKEVIQDWLNKNKNVTIKASSYNLANTDQQAQAAIAARTAPSLMAVFSNLALTRSASKVKFAADVTDLYHQYDLDNKLADYAKPLFKNGYNLDGKYYALPGDGVGAGAGLYYRRDLLKERGIDEPQFGWSWNQFYALLRQFQTDGKPVMGAPSWMFAWIFNSNQLDRQPNGILGSVPSPKTPWHWQINIDPWVETWTKLAQDYRKAALDDNLIEQNTVAYPWEGPAMGKFASGQYPFSPGYAFQGTISGYAPVTPVDMPAKYGKPFDDLVGFISYPKGQNGSYNSGIYGSISGQVMFPSYVKSEVLQKAVDLYIYRVYGDGYINKYAKKYELTKQPQDAYKFIAPANIYQKNPKVPADVTVENAYGVRWVKSYMDPIKNLAPLPQIETFFAPDKQTGPTSAAHDDLLAKLSQSKDNVSDILHNFQQVYNQQASTLQSDLSPEEFTASAKKYLAALDTYFKANQPDFYEGDWTKYYTKYALPALS
ncbi:ABC transporter substrate-binding protein [Tengunoibacter tsumagoiensis]|uniref:ABC transporter substrate-binding protein n=1 Tax=Tengunoibacter tsumagoiensis TaxID=2014871 RepID=A0A402A6M2_9CHLR|nr:ABC transporter substrate-binding protein [Tengunoibacter tsumagoiensis]GCE14784.1 hypothetical protein KTT_46430 [Tengunoibacter tsumagoiensis]